MTPWMSEKKVRKIMSRMHGNAIERAVLGFTVALFMAGYAFAADKHECGYCHVSSAGGTDVRLKNPLAELCVGCHPERKSGSEHRVGLSPSVKVDLPLTKDGKMTCVTCHDPHSKGEYPKLLRVAPSALCLKCHFL
ncbi:MAG: cytochrome c3 family protein [Nitrospirae bacterium]|nr:cytochrome c3 family protein [Nitrospirota bacterium]